MLTLLKRISSQTIKFNWKSGVTVALVSLPLSISLAIASQTTPIAGIITAIWAGLIASFFGGSNYNIVGPTGALSGVLATYAIAHGAQALPLLAVFSGIFILIAYLLRLEKFLNFVPGSTIQGFTLGVATIIGFNQLNFALGLSGLEKHEKFVDNIVESFAHVSQMSGVTFVIFIIFLVGLFLFLKFLPRIPGAILLTPLGILLGYASQAGWLPFKLQTLGTLFGDIKPLLFISPSFVFDRSIFSSALTIAVIAILETMISAKIADGMTKTRHNARKEIFGLGVANIFSGLMGGIPATAALARTSVNINNGATDRVSALISSISIGIISFALLSFFKFIPMAVIASILVFAAIRMVETHKLRHMATHDKKGIGLAALVFAVTVYEDPLIGILLGTLISLVIFADRLSRGQFEMVMNDTAKGVIGRVSDEKLAKLIPDHNTLVYSIKGILTYLNGQAHISRLLHTKGSQRHIVLRLRELYFIDSDGIQVLDEIIELIRDQKKDVILTGVSVGVGKRLLAESKEYAYLHGAGKVFEKTIDALTNLGYTPNSTI